MALPVQPADNRLNQFIQGIIDAAQNREELRELKALLNQAETINESLKSIIFDMSSSISQRLLDLNRRTNLSKHFTVGSMCSGSAATILSSDYFIFPSLMNFFTYASCITGVLGAGVYIASSLEIRTLEDLKDQLNKKLKQLELKE